MQLKLDLQFFAGEKTEKATPKKREDERKKGRVAKSQDVGTAVLLFFSFIILGAFGSLMGSQMRGMYHNVFTNFIHWEVTIESVRRVFLENLITFFYIVAPIMLMSLVISVAVNLVQVGFLFTTEPLKFDLKKIDPIKGAKRIFSIRALVELLKSFFKITFIGMITFTVIWIFKDEMLMLAFKSPQTAVSFFGQVTITMGIAATIALLFLAVLDYMYQKYDFEKNIRMSKQDIKDEHKNIEGDPLIKSKIREQQRQIAMRRMMEEIPQADVVITNPTHYAVAIKYDETVADAPIVVAKGKDAIALRIIDTAKEHGVMTVENKPLARSLYAQVELDETIPEEFFQAVAEVLAYVYSLEQKSV